MPVAGNAASAFVIAQGWAILGGLMMLIAMAWTMSMSVRHMTGGWAADRTDLRASMIWACLGASVTASYILAFGSQ